MRSFINRNKCLMRNRRNITPQRHKCRVCHIVKDLSELHHICAKNVRIVLMVGCILRGTHSVEQAKSYITNKVGITCYYHRQESIDIIFKQTRISNEQKLSNWNVPVMSGLVDIAKNFDPNFTVEQFFRASNKLYMKEPNV
ncbi:unnamed protein product [Caenorhabditis nigoni]|uniref:Lin-15A/B-like domain-containing protein n=1 Tax=Caenorhabditis nigoni TaxID=1611254 RepID=A0A2G5SIG5_9PELO|nr:hypothetical protein B9Z55_026890 [Caenorhabditis nigoni]